jgi:hypothetical protein
MTARLFIKQNKYVKENMELLFFWCLKADTPWDPVFGNKNVYFLQRETI